MTPPAYTSRAADLPHRRGGEAARLANIRCRSAASSRCAPAAPTTSPWSASTKPARRRPRLSRPLPARVTKPGEGQPIERQVELGKAVDVVVRKGDRDVMQWRFTVEPDHAPEIAFLKPPAPARSGALSPHLFAQGRLRRRLRQCRDRAARRRRRKRHGAAAVRGAADRAVAAAASHARRRVARRSATSPPIPGPAPR